MLTIELVRYGYNDTIHLAYHFTVLDLHFVIILTADGQKILENQKKIMSILHNLSNKHCTVMDVEEDVIDILPQKCTTLQELLDLDKRLKGDRVVKIGQDNLQKEEGAHGK